MMHEIPEQEPVNETAPRHAADPLSRRLRDWRRRQDALCDHTALTARVVQSIRTETVIAAEPSLRPHDRWMERSAWFTAGLAAAVAVAWFVRPTRQDDVPADWLPSVRFAEGQIAEKADLVAGMEATFGDGLAWIAEHGREVDVGIIPGGCVPEGCVPGGSVPGGSVQVAGGPGATGPGSAGGGPLAVRIIVLARRAGDEPWQTAWRSDLITRDEQVVDVSTGPGDAGRLRLWSHVLPDGAVAIDGEIRLPGAAAPLDTAPLDVSYSGVQRAGEPSRVLRRRAHGIEWQIIQTVEPLARGGRFGSHRIPDRPTLGA